MAFPLLIGTYRFHVELGDRANDDYANQEIIMIAPHHHSYDQLRKLIKGHFDWDRPMHKKTTRGPETDLKFVSLAVHWSLPCGAGSSFWPDRTEITKENINAVMEMLKAHGGCSILVVEYKCKCED